MFPSSDIERVKFRCLNCGESGFNGTRNRHTGELKCQGLHTHIKLKKSGRSRRYDCRKFYEEAMEKDGIVGYDLESSLMQEFATTAGKRPHHQDMAEQQDEEQTNFSVDGGSAPSDEDSQSSTNSLGNKLGEFQDVVLPKSNSLNAMATFSNNPLNLLKSAAKFNQVDNRNLDSCTYPSKKLFPAATYETILEYASAKGILAKLESKAGNLIHQQTNVEKEKCQAVATGEQQSSRNREDVVQDKIIILEDTSVASSQRSIANVLNYDTAEEGEGDDDDGEVEIVEHPPGFPGRFAGPTTHNMPNANYLLTRLAQETSDQTNSASEIPTQVKTHIQLLHLQEKHKMSLAAVTDILKWAKTATSLDPEVFTTNFPPRDTMICQYRGYLGLGPDAYKFKEKVVQWLPDKKPAIIRCRPFLDCVYELLTKKSLLGKNSSNISLPHPTNPFACKPDDTPPKISEVHHGSWWRKTMKQCCKGEKEILCPLAFEVDETYLDTHGRLTVTPFNIRLLIFNIDANKSVEASTTWFYLPNDQAEAAHHEAKTLAIHKIQNLHAALRECFKDLKYLMDNNIGIPWKLFYGGKEHDVLLKFALAFIVSDTDIMHDKLCCHYGVRTRGIKSICRHCNCATEHLSSAKHFRDYRQWTTEELDPTVDANEKDMEYWKSISHYPVKNALDELYHGSNKAKTHLNTCGEVLHMHQLGAMKRVIESFVYQWSKGQAIEIDDVKMSKKKKNITVSLNSLDHLAHQYGALLNRQSDREKPRTKFKNEMFSTTKKASHEYAGVLLCVLLCLLSDRGRQICLQERTMKQEWAENQVYILELILMLEVWMKKREFPRHQLQDSAALFSALGSYMDLLTVICPREGMGSLLIKFHLMFHIPEYVMRWGPPTAVDSSMLEKSHKTEAKDPARLTQQRPETFMSQLPDRYSDRRIVRRFRDFFGMDHLFDKSLPRPGEQDTSHQERDSITGSPFTLGVDLLGRPGVKWKKRPGRQTHIQAVQDFVAHLLLPNLPQQAPKVIKGFTEYRISHEGKEHIYRAHPSYKSTSRQRRDVWYDWAKFNLSDQGMDTVPLPGQILMFVHVPFLRDEVRHKGIRLVSNSPHAVVRLFQSRPKNNFRPGQRVGGVMVPYSSLVKFGKVREHFLLIPCKYIVGPAIVVPNVEVKGRNHTFTGRNKNKKQKQHADEMAEINPLGPGYFIVEPRFEWGEAFGRLVESFSSSDNPPPV